MWTLFSVELNVCSQKLEVTFWPTGTHCRGTAMYFFHLVGEAVSLEFCGICKDTYTKWKHRPRPQCDCESEGAGACPIMCTSPTVLPALRLEHVQSKSSAQRLSEGKVYQLWRYRVDEKARQRLIRACESRKSHGTSQSGKNKQSVNIRKLRLYIHVGYECVYMSLSP